MAAFFSVQKEPAAARPGDIWRDSKTGIARVMNYAKRWELLDTVLQKRELDPSLDAARAALAHVLRLKREGR